MFDLSRFRVLELGTGITIPLCGTVLANLGAEVIKLESSRKPDLNRARAVLPSWNYRDPKECFFQFHEVNAGKKSVTLNLKHAQAKGILLRLCAESDVLIQNFAPGWLDRLSLTVDDFWQANPSLVMVFVSAYGQEGPLREQRAYAPIMSALAGLDGIVGYEGEEPVGVEATAFGDPNASYFAAWLAMSGLYRRQRTGEGALIDLSCIEAVAAVLGPAILEVQQTGERPRLRGVHADTQVPHGVYPAQGEDAWLAVSARDDAEWAKLAALMLGETGRPSPWSDPALATLPGRLAAQAEIDRALAAWSQGRPAQEAAELLQSHGVPAAPVLDVRQVDRHPHFVERGLLHRVTHHELGEIEVTGTPWVVDGAPPPVHGPGPIFGRDNEAVYGRLLGLDRDAYQEMRASGLFD